jgi:hypothetical protein
MSLVVLKRKHDENKKSKEIIKYNPFTSNNIVRRFHNTYQYNHVKSDANIHTMQTLSQSERLQKTKKCITYESNDSTNLTNTSKSCLKSISHTVKNVSTMSSSERLQLKYNM